MNRRCILTLIVLISVSWYPTRSIAQALSADQLHGAWRYELLVHGSWETLGAVKVESANGALLMEAPSINLKRNTDVVDGDGSICLSDGELLDAKIEDEAWSFDFKIKRDEQFGIRRFRLHKKTPFRFEGETLSPDQRLKRFPVRLTKVNTKPTSIVILIHGVYSNSDVFSRFQTKVADRKLPGAWIVPFDWGPEPVFNASSNVGNRASVGNGMSKQAFVAAAKLKEVVGRIRENLGDEVPINIVAHSQGTIVTLAALQEGMSIDNWILLGSTLSQENISSGAFNTRLADGAKNVRGKVINFWSQADRTVSWVGGAGIGCSGLPHLIQKQERSTTGSLNIEDQEVVSVNHFGEEGWWDCDWLCEDDKRKWEKGVSKQSVYSLLHGPLTGVAPVTDAFKAIQGFASAGTRKRPWRGIFGSRNKNEHSTTFTLTKGMSNGIFFDRKQASAFEVECVVGACEFQLMSGAGNDFTDHSEAKTLKAGESAKGNYQSKEASQTIFLVAKGTGDGITKVRCTLKATK